MAEAAPTELKNQLLRSLPQTSLSTLLPQLEHVELPRRFRLAKQRIPYVWVYFPECGVASTIATAGGVCQEIGLFGREGAGSLSGFLTSQRALYDIEMQIAGHGNRILVTSLIRLFRDDPNVRGMILRYVQVCIVQVTQTALANTRLNAEQRLARWLLMIHDRLDGDGVCLTHDCVSIMLGVSRPAVTMALQALEGVQLISLNRRRIDIINRTGLEQMTQKLYGLAEAEYAEAFSADKASLNSTA